MPVFHAGHFRVFWHVLMDAAFRTEDLGDDSQVTIISPWISDVMTSESGWSETCMSAAFDTHGGSPEALSDVLGELVRVGYEVTVVTLSTTGKWLPKARNEHLDRERDFMEKIRDLGVTCLIRHDVHMKYVKTPFALMDGSINISFNGLSGRNHEAANLYFHDAQQQDFSQRRERISAVLVGARDYFSPRIPITQWIPPSFQPFPGSSAPDLSGVAMAQLPPVGELYAPMVPSDFSPVGAVQMGGKPEVGLSLKAQFSQLLYWSGVWALELLANEMVEGLDHGSVYDSIVQDMGGEMVTSPSAMRERLLSTDDYNAQHSVRTRLGLVDDDAMWMEWRGLAEGLIGGLEFLSDRISSGSAPSDEDFALLSRLNSLYDRLHQR